MNKLKPHFLYPPKPPRRSAPHSAAATSSTKYWNATINCLSSEGAHYSVLLTYSSMLQIYNVYPDAYTFPSLLKSCTSLNFLSHGLSCHQHIIVNGCSSDAYVASSLINFYAKFGYTHYARQLFEKMPCRNVVPWTAMIGCYSRAGDVRTAFSMYNQMQCDGIQPSSVTMLALLYEVSEDTARVKYLHACIVKYGFGCDIAVVNSMVNLLGKCGRVEDARDLFESMDRRDIVSWNSLVSAYGLIGNVREVLQLLHMMRFEGMEPDQQTFGALVSATARQDNLATGKSVHAHILTSGFKLDTPIETLLIIMYLKYGNLDDAYTIFEQTSDKDTIIWTTMISGLVQNECADKAVSLFRQMLISRVMPSTATIASALAACSHLGSFNLGTSIHGYIIRKRLPVDIPTQNSLVIQSHLENGRPVTDDFPLVYGVYLPCTKYP